MTRTDYTLLATGFLLYLTSIALVSVHRDFIGGALFVSGTLFHCVNFLKDNRP